MKTDQVNNDFKIVIPARMASTRFPGKALKELLGKPMLGHVYDRAVSSGAAQIVVAVDDQQLADYCEDMGCDFVMTSPDHVNGTERIAEVARTLRWTDDTVIVGLQCDEPATPPAIVRQVAKNLAIHADADMATLCTRITQKNDYLDPNRVKVVRDTHNFALYFSRAPIPWRRDVNNKEDDASFPDSWLHIGMYAYRAGFLKRYVSFYETQPEREEKLEQLRALGYGCRIHVDESIAPPSHGVDLPSDLAEAERALKALLDEGG